MILVILLGPINETLFSDAIAESREAFLNSC